MTVLVFFISRSSPGQRAGFVSFVFFVVIV